MEKFLAKLNSSLRVFLLTALTVMLVAGCGGSGAGGGTKTKPPIDPTNPISGCTDPKATNYNANATQNDGSCVFPVAPPANLELLVSNAQLGSDGASEVTLTAVTKDSKNNALENQAIDFTTDFGKIIVTRKVTDKTGTATATLSTSGDKANRIINVTANAAGVASTNKIEVTGTTVSITGQSAMVAGTTSDISIFLKDSSGKGIPNQAVTLSSTLGNTLSSVAPITDALGQAKVTYAATKGGTDTLKASALNAAGALTTTISTTDFTITAAAPPAGSSPKEVKIGDSRLLTVHYAIAGVPQGGVVNLATTRGTLTPSGAISLDANGNATVSLSGVTAGPALVSASINGGPATQIPMELIAVTPSKITVQPSPSTIGVNFNGSTAEKSTIKAVVRDIANNPVKNQTVVFNLSTDVSGGGLSQGTAISDSNGEAFIVYTAGASVTPLNGIVIDAYVQGSPAVKTFATLTVGKKALFIKIGTGNFINIESPTQYSQDFVILVTDAAGNPVSGVPVTLNLIPVSYDKGYYSWTNFFDLNVNNNFAWAQVRMTNASFDPADPLFSTHCSNEDKNQNGLLDGSEDTNRNGVLDAGEDINGNGVLDFGEDINKDGTLTPGNPATVVGNPITDATGASFIKVIYAKEFASWVAVKLEAKAVVSGSESASYTSFTLRGAGSDYTDLAKPPAGIESPYGRGALQYRDSLGNFQNRIYHDRCDEGP